MASSYTVCHSPANVRLCSLALMLSQLFRPLLDILLVLFYLFSCHIVHLSPALGPLQVLIRFMSPSLSRVCSLCFSIAFILLSPALFPRITNDIFDDGWPTTRLSNARVRMNQFEETEGPTRHNASQGWWLHLERSQEVSGPTV